MTQDDGEHYRKIINCWFCEKDYYSKMVRLEVIDNCHFTGKYRCPAHAKSKKKR